MPIFLNFWPCDRPGVPGGHDEAGLAPRPELGVDGGDHHVDVGDAAVGDPRLGAVEHPLVLGLVVDGPGAQRRTRRSRRRARDTQNAASLIFVGRAEALRHPLADLLGRAVADDAGDAERRARRWRGRCRRHPSTAPR